VLTIATLPHSTKPLQPFLNFIIGNVTILREKCQKKKEKMIRFREKKKRSDNR